MQKYQIPMDCTVNSNSAADFIYGLQDTISHIGWEKQNLEEMGQMELAQKCDDLIDMYKDMQAIACETDRLGDELDKNPLAQQAMKKASQDHMMEHITGEDREKSPAGGETLNDLDREIMGKKK